MANAKFTGPLTIALAVSVGVLLGVANGTVAGVIGGGILLAVGVVRTARQSSRYGSGFSKPDPTVSGLHRLRQRFKTDRADRE